MFGVKSCNPTLETSGFYLFGVADSTNSLIAEIQGTHIDISACLCWHLSASQPR